MIQAQDDDQLWSEYKRSGDRSLRDQLIVRYAPLVKFVASRVSASLPDRIEQSDLTSYGTFGLIDAIEKFDTDRGVRFEAYAISRIKGAIIDELRSIDWVPRSLRAKARTLEQASMALEGTGQAHTSADLAAHLQIPEVEVQQITNQISYASIMTLDGESDGMTLSETIAGPDQEPTPVQEVEEMKHVLAHAIDRLGQREKMVLALYYYEGLTLAQSGQVFGVTESRICQIHTKAITRLRSNLRKG